ncbi:MAG: hypothetical protein KME09_00790 [Pleurocapsa minor HA4230-MV1]|jgi:hypothetical protein|nr:hypothetical protein [Pleurocapsa minor HA4230-MV1]
MKSENLDLDQPVFTSCKGNPIDDHNFRNRAWKSVLAKVGVEYRKPYNFFASVPTLNRNEVEIGWGGIAHGAFWARRFLPKSRLTNQES